MGQEGWGACGPGPATKEDAMTTFTIVAGMVCCLLWVGALVEFARLLSELSRFRAKYGKLPQAS